tara:strand:- start:1406 stop:4033 length:2628 start_codon:yes stop_codon:yes gene_type:complete
VGNIASRLAIWTMATAACLVPEIALAGPLPAVGLGATFITGVSAVAIPSIMITLSQFALGIMIKSILAPKMPRYPGVDVNFNGSASAAPIIYGTTKVGGVIFYQEVPSEGVYARKILQRLIAVCGHEVEGIVSYHIDDEELTLDGNGTVNSGTYKDLIRIIPHLGSPDQLAAQEMLDETSNLWTTACTASGIAYVHAKFQFNMKKFSSGPPSILVVVKGKKLYDPRTGLTVYSSNSALCLRDYLLTSRIAEEDELDDTSFAAAANICDEDVTLDAGGTEKRYSCDGFFSTEGKPMDILNSITMSMAGSIWFSQGKWVCKAGAYTESVMSFDEGDLHSPLKVVTRTSRRDLFNRATGVFRGEVSNWQEDNFPPVLSSTFEEDDGGEISEVEIDLPFTSSSSRAQRIAKVLLYKQREQISVTGEFSLRAMELTPGDTIKLTLPRMGFDEKTFEVIEWSFAVALSGELSVSLVLQEISAAVYDWNLVDESVFETQNTTLLSPDYVPPISLSFAALAVFRIVNENLVAVLSVEVSTSEDDLVDSVEVQYRTSEVAGSPDATWKAMGTGELPFGVGTFELLNASPGTTYYVRARALNGIGVWGEWVYGAQVLSGYGDAPSDIDGFNGVIDGGSLHFSWDASTDPTLSHYVLRHAEEGYAAANFANAITMVRKISRPATSIVAPVMHGTYMLRAYSKNGQGSDGYAKVNIPEQDVDDYSTEIDLNESTFPGSKTNCEISAGRLVLTSTTPGSAGFATGTYEFNGYIDTTTARQVHSHIHIRTIRSATGGDIGTWDGIPGLWDTWPGSWDNWTTSAEQADTDVLFFISTTNDDPAGTPTWGAWRQFRGGDFYGRAFKYKVELRSDSETITPSIGLLEAFVGY